MKNDCTFNGRRFVTDNLGHIEGICHKTIKSFKQSGYTWIDDFESEEIESKVKMKILTSRTGYDPEKGTIYTWVKKITENVIKSEQDELFEHESYFYEYDDEEDDECERAELGTKWTPIDYVIAGETEDTINRTLDTVSEVSRDIYCLSREGYSKKEIAEQLGMNPNAVGVRDFRVKEKVAAALAA